MIHFISRICHVSTKNIYSNIYIYIYISSKIQRYTFYFYLETALYVSGVTSTHHQERKQLYLQNLVFVRPLLLPAAMRQITVTV
jgi:hypothetical protein